MTKSVQIKELEIGKGMPKICVPLTAVTRDALCEEAKKASEAQPDLVEWRADFYENLFEISKTVETLELLKRILGEIPLLFTIRTKEEGGNVAISMDDYVDINLAAASQGKADLIDVEIFSGIDNKCAESVNDPKEEVKDESVNSPREEVKDESVNNPKDESEDELESTSAKRCNDLCFRLVSEKICLIEKIHETEAKVIASSHDFGKTDSREVLLKKFQAMDKSGADVLKMAVMPQGEDDVRAIMEVTDKMRKDFTERPLVSMSMGSLGSVSRVEGERFGSSITFATVGAASAPGQIPIKTLKMKMEEVHKNLLK